MYVAVAVTVTVTVVETVFVLAYFIHSTRIHKHNCSPGEALIIFRASLRQKLAINYDI